MCSHAPCAVLSSSGERVKQADRYPRLNLDGTLQIWQNNELQASSAHQKQAENCQEVYEKYLPQLE